MVRNSAVWRASVLTRTRALHSSVQLAFFKPKYHKPPCSELRQCEIYNVMDYVMHIFRYLARI